MLHQILGDERDALVRRRPALPAAPTCVLSFSLRSTLLAFGHFLEFGVNLRAFVLRSSSSFASRLS